MRVRMEETGVPEASSHVPRIADFTGITFTIHERRAGHFSRPPPAECLEDDARRARLGME